MKILLTTHQFFPKHGSGTEVLARDTGLEMIERGHEVNVLTVDPTLKTDSEEVTYEDYEFLGLKVRALGLPTMPEAIDRIRYEYDNAAVARHVRRYLEEIAPDAVHVFHAARLSGSVIDAFKGAGLPVVYTPTDFWAICVRNTLMKPSGELSEGPDDISSNCLECRQVERLLPATHILRKSLKRSKKDFYRETAERALAGRKGEHPSMALVRGMLDRTEFLRGRFNSVDAILAPTKLMHRMLTTNGIDPGLVSLSPYGMNISQFRDLEPSRRNGPGGLRFGYIGTFHPQKGVHVLVEAFKSLPRDANATLRLCGSFAHFPEYSREVYDLARSDPRINFAGAFPNEKIGEEMGKIDVLVVPSTWYENTPLVIYSAFAAKVPVVATNLGGMAEVVHHEENGLLFEPGDPQDLARQLGRLLVEPDSLAKYSGNVGDVRTVEDSVDEMLGLYENLLREKGVRDQERAREASSTDDWLWLNRLGISKDPELERYAAPFPPEELRYLPTGKADKLDFAVYGVEAYRTLLETSPEPWERMAAVLDYGCGPGPVARLFEVSGVDLYAVDPDAANVGWIRSNLPSVLAATVHRDDPLPYVSESFDAAYSMSAFVRGGRERHEAQLADLARVTKAGAPVFLAVFGERAFERAKNEAGIRSALGLDGRLLEEVARKFEGGEVATAGDGLAFVPGSYVRENWTGWFDLVGIQQGALRDLQDIVVLQTRAEKPGLRDTVVLWAETERRRAESAASKAPS